MGRDRLTRGTQMLRGFGIEKLMTTSTGEEATRMSFADCPGICFVEGALAAMGTADAAG